MVNENDGSSILVTRGLTRNFGALKVTNEVDFELAVGARHALIGPNGAGKTTFVNLLTGILRPSAGSIWANNEDITRASPEQRVRQGIGRTFQINSLFRELTVLENIAMSITAQQGIGHRVFGARASMKDCFERAYELLCDFDLQHVADKEIKSIAYGEQRLVEIAIALGLQPKVLILDEPAAGIPSSESHVILDVLRKLPPSVSILIIEHDMNLVFQFATRITVLVQGSVLLTDTPEAIARDTRVKEVYLGNR